MKDHSKNFVILILIIALTFPTLKALEGDIHCDLSIRVFPLVYYGQTKNIEFRVMFLSSCLDFPLLFYFTLPYDHKYELYTHTHPSFVRMILFGRTYDFKFADAYER